MRLLERAEELDEIGAALAGAQRGRGSVLVVSGAAGIGKTALLAEAAGGAVRALRARGGELERDLALGVARQLLEPALDRADQRERLLEATGPAAAVLSGRARAGEGDQSVILHGLHRLVANLAHEAPLLIAVDDVQWADAASLRFLAFHARRLGELPVVLLLARRSGEAATEPAAMRALLELPETRERVLTALSASAARQIVRELAGGHADERFCAACHTASAGNPFVLGELVRSLLARGVRPDAEGAAQVAEAGPPTVARWVLGRLERLPAGASALARAVAVLGEDAGLGRTARLAGQSLEDAEAALDALAGADLLVPERPLRFVHPVVLAAVRDAVPAGARSREHRRAARLLRDEGALPGKVGTHLLAAEPGGERWVCEALVEAAQIALAQGAAEIAASHARRALAEPPDGQLRPRVLRALGNAERRLGIRSADERFLAAIEETSDPRERAETLLEMLITGSPAVDVLELARRTLAEVAPVDPDLALVVRARLLLALEATGQPIDRELRAAEQALAEAGGESLGTRLIAGMLARDAAFRAQPRSRVLPLARRAVGDPDTYADDLHAGYPHVYAVTALALSDELALAEQRYAAAVAAAERRGSLVGAGIARFMRAHAHVRRGDLAAAERDGRHALAAAERTSEPWLRAIAVAALTEALTERGELRAAQAVLDESGLATAVPETFYLSEVAASRSALHLVAGRPADALDDATAVGRFAEAAGVRHPALVPWRSLSARALIALGRPAEASVLAREELAIAETAEVPSAIGAARRIVALATGGDQMIPLLREAVATLESTPARLELARALTDLGAALRRAGHRSDAREPLSRAFELSHRVGARLLADAARTELQAAGARPRRAFRTGVEALTPSERRVAELAAAGLANSEIAARLFITRKTTEHHLAAVYRKLDITSRRDLPAALGTGPTPDPGHARSAAQPQR